MAIDRLSGSVLSGCLLYPPDVTVVRYSPESIPSTIVNTQLLKFLILFHVNTECFQILT